MTSIRTLAPRGVLLVASVVVVWGAAGDAAADSRGACVETSATSAPTSAPLALDEDRAAWVAGTWFLDRAADSGRRAGGNPAWCESGDEPQCDSGGEAPTRDERVNSSDVGAALSEQPAFALVGSAERPAHPPIPVGHGATETRSELERPPQLG